MSILDKWIIYGVLLTGFVLGIWFSALLLKPHYDEQMMKDLAWIATNAQLEQLREIGALK